MEAGGGAGSGTRVSEGAIAYTLGREPHTGTGIARTSGESDDSLGCSGLVLWTTSDYIANVRSQDRMRSE